MLTATLLATPTTRPNRWPPVTTWLLAAGLLTPGARAQAQTTTYSYSGAPQYYTVPAGVTLVQVVATGASGGSLSGSSGGLGAQVQAQVPVAPGEQLTIILGGQGAGSAVATSNAGGNNGGGAGTSAGGTSVLANGAGGGGATDLRRGTTTRTDDYLSSRNALLVAGGGGGSGNGGLVAQASTVDGGAGGTPDAQVGSGSNGGAGATQTAAGGAAINNTGSNGRTGGGGGGGSGYYGGSGGARGSGGGGGSSWATATASSVAYTLATSAGNGSLSITPVSPLPVQLVRFTAQRVAPAAVALNWLTASEVSSAYFAVERSLDGQQFAELARVPAAGSSTDARAYQYRDAAALTSPQVYYRLRQVDLDGTLTYSPVIAVMGKEAVLTLGLYPNPAVGRRVQVVGADPTVPLRAFDAQGRVVREWPAGTSGFTTDDLPAGLYLLRSGSAIQRLQIP